MNLSLSCEVLVCPECCCLSVCVCLWWWWDRKANVLRFKAGRKHWSSYALRSKVITIIIIYYYYTTVQFQFFLSKLYCDIYKNKINPL